MKLGVKTNLFLRVNIYKIRLEYPIDRESVIETIFAKAQVTHPTWQLFQPAKF